MEMIECERESKESMIERESGWEKDSMIQKRETERDRKYEWMR